MAEIPAFAIARLRQGGLWVSTPYRSDHRAFPGGVFVEPSDDTKRYQIDTPYDDPNEIREWAGPDAVRLFSHDGVEWFVDAVRGSGGYCAADFCDVWPNIDSAVEDLFDYFSCGSLRFKALEALREAHVRRHTNPYKEQEAISNRPKLSGTSIVRLRGAGLSVDDSAFDRVKVWSDSGQSFLSVYTLDGRSWIVNAAESLIDEGLAYGEFYHLWQTEDLAVDDVIDFWLGSGIRKRAFQLGRERLQSAETANESTRS